MNLQPTPPARQDESLAPAVASVTVWNRTAASSCVALCTVALFALSAHAENKTTCYRDGTLYSREAGAVKGIIDMPLAAGVLAHTFTIIPAPGTTILSVEQRRNRPGGDTARLLETLTEQRLRLTDRLQALETRESIFTSAAKSQSGKAPRKTKANPDPMQTIRQGTDFAIAQLEAVYTVRRKTAQEIQKIDARIAAARGGGRTEEGSVRISVTPPRGRVTLRYATAEVGWQPQYDLHLSEDGFARLQFSARVREGFSDQRVMVSSGALADSPQTAVPVQSGRGLLATYRIPVTEVSSFEGVFHRFSGRITNSTPDYLPAGESGLFRNGTYLGKFRFEGISSGRSRVISIGS